MVRRHETSSRRDAAEVGAVSIEAGHDDSEEIFAVRRRTSGLCWRKRSQLSARRQNLFVVACGAASA